MNAGAHTGDGRFNSAVRWALAMNWGQRGLAALVTFLLAALIGPEGFGLVAMAAVYIYFVSIFVEQGLLVAIVQRKELEDEHVDASFWITMLVGVALAGLSLLISGPWARYEQQPLLGPVVNALALTVPISAAAIVPEALLTRRLQFKSLALRTNVAAIVGGVIGIGMAFGGLGVWALVGQRVATVLCGTALLWAVADWRPKRRFSRRHAIDMISFSTQNLAARLADFVGARIDVLLMGSLLGPAAAGLYRLADRIVTLPSQLLTRSFSSPSMAYMSEAQHEPEEFCARTLKFARLLAAATFPVMAGLVIVAAPLMEIFGPRWAPAVGALQALAIVAAVRGVLVICGTVLIAAGRPSLDAINMWVSAAAHLGAVVVALALSRSAPTSQQLLWIAGAHLGAMIVVDLPLQGWQAIRCTRLTLGQSVRAMLPALGSAVATLVAGFTLDAVLPALAGGGWTRGLLVGSVGGGAGLATLLALDRSILTSLRAMRAARRARNRAPAAQSGAQIIPEGEALPAD